MRLLVGKKNVYLWKDGDLSVTEGLIRENDILNAKPGDIVRTNKGESFFILEPRILDYFKFLKRGPQVILPKDAIYMVNYAGVKEGDIVVEIGTGSGWLTIFLALAVGKGGKVISYDINKKFLDIARENLEMLDLLDRVELRYEDPIGVGVPECDHIFVDIREPWKVLKFRDKVYPGGYFVFYTIQMTQVQEIEKKVREFEDLSLERVVEIIEREWVVKEKILRPRQWLDHTGFLVFVRKL